MSYCVLDAARLEERLDRAREKAGPNTHWCLYQGASAEQMANVAPYLFLSSPPDLLDWLFTDGWGDAWGIFALSRATPDVLYHHFRRFLLVQTEAGQSLYFRFYDPRVLRRFLHTCTPLQLTNFFGPIRYFLVEDEDPVFGISYWLQDGELKQQRMPRAEAEQAYRAYLRAA